MMKNWVKSKTKMRRCWQLLQQGRTLSQSEASSHYHHHHCPHHHHHHHHHHLGSSLTNVHICIYSWQTPPKLASLLEHLMKTITIDLILTFHPFNSSKVKQGRVCPVLGFFRCDCLRKNYTTRILRANRVIHHVSHWKRWGVKMTIDDGRMRWFSYFVTSKINCHLHLLQLSVPEEKVQILEIFSPLPSYSPGKLHHNTCLS